MPKHKQQTSFDELPTELVQEIREKILKWGKDNYQDFLWRKTKNSFHALIAEVMLQRTRAEQVQPIYISFIESYPNIQAAEREEPEKIRQLLNSLGLKWRIEKILELIRVLAESGKVPSNRNALLRLPGVGPYVTNAFLSLFSNQKAALIDSNAVRLWARLFGYETDADTRKRKWFIDFANKITPEKDFKNFNYAVLDFTRSICKPTPICKKCPLQSYCLYFLRLENQKA